MPQPTFRKSFWNPPGNQLLPRKGRAFIVHHRYTLKTEHCSFLCNHNLALTEPALWSSFRLISISQLNASQHLHL